MFSTGSRSFSAQSFARPWRESARVQTVSSQPNLLLPQVECSICLEGDADVLLPCGHRYHADCLDRWFETRQVCPTCGRAYGDTVGTMPDGVMSWHFRKQRLAGYSCPTVVLHFFFPRGTVDGEEFEGRSQHAYLPGRRRRTFSFGPLPVGFPSKTPFRSKTFFDDRAPAADIFHPHENVHEWWPSPTRVPGPTILQKRRGRAAIGRCPPQASLEAAF